ncbi:MAG: Transcriptional regulator of nonfermentable carbon utilization [Geoglossum simile]|nr:MAG: Transcriptional regulator of nonfermentable carbon utilization [Geoglossum simile]
MPLEADNAITSTDLGGELEVSDMVELNGNGVDEAAPAAPSSNGATLTNAKDALRPRRKKARRACHACQRAHLTCGDERPCQRCIKRGLQDACHDGVRKKAKYLHDAPNEALMPSVAGNLNNISTVRNNSLPTSASDTAPSTGQHSGFFPTSQPQASAAFAMFPSSTPAPCQMPPPFQEGAINPTSFSSQQPPISPTMATGQQASPLQAITASVSQPSPATHVSAQNIYGGPLFDPSDPALFNFDLASLNFGNHYGALEFGMLGHMASGTAETPPSDTNAAATQPGGGAPGFATSGSSAYSSSPRSAATYMFPQDVMTGDWQSPGGANRQGNVFNGNGRTHSSSANVPHAYAIGIGPGSLTSPSPPAPSPGLLPAFEQSPTMQSFYNTASSGQQQQPMGAPHQQQQQQQPQGAPTMAPKLQPQSTLGKRPRDPSATYKSVKQPYPYTMGFHSLTAFLQRRFPPQKTLRIAKSLASIRPSFISCTKTLNRDDLIFMEKCFQRTLYEYEDFINAVGTPTIVCRRTGEVAAVGKEFSILTGWKKDVLLGREPNLNINTGGTSGPGTGSTSLRSNLSRYPELKNREDDGTPRIQPVFLAELLDDDSVIEFYEDFAKLAFGDSRGSINTRCKLLRYRTKHDPEYNSSSNNNPDNIKAEAGASDNSNTTTTTTTTANNNSNSNSNKNNKNNNCNGNKSNIQNEDSNNAAATGASASLMSPMQRNHHQTPLKHGIIRTSVKSGEAGFNGLGAKDGKVECSYCWTVKRDVFDIPMLIVMNVSSILSYG